MSTNCFAQLLSPLSGRCWPLAARPPCSPRVAAASARGCGKGGGVRVQPFVTQIQMHPPFTQRAHSTPGDLPYRLKREQPPSTSTAMRSASQPRLRSRPPALSISVATKTSERVCLSASTAYLPTEHVCAMSQSALRRIPVPSAAASQWHAYGPFAISREMPRAPLSLHVNARTTFDLYPEFNVESRRALTRGAGRHCIARRCVSSSRCPPPQQALLHGAGEHTCRWLRTQTLRAGAHTWQA